VPLFIKMNLKEKAILAIEKALIEYPSLFLINVTVKEDNKIYVALDGDHGVNLQDCIAVNRAIEAELDREVEDYALEVASAGVSSPLKFPRQYKKNIGRTLKLKTTNNGDFEAKIQTATETEVTFVWTVREPKPLGKGKVTVEKQLTLAYPEIKEAIVTITF
jgi:ribosome maturation factor RimP